MMERIRNRNTNGLMISARPALLATRTRTIAAEIGSVVVGEPVVLLTEPGAVGVVVVEVIAGIEAGVAAVAVEVVSPCTHTHTVVVLSLFRMFSPLLTAVCRGPRRSFIIVQEFG